MKNKTKPMTYRDAGVDIDAGNQLVEKIKPFVAKTKRVEVMAGLGGFGGLFALQSKKYKEPILVSGTDGVGTKLMLAHQTNYHEYIGIDLVAMCVNDVLVQGAEPLFFLDYFACGKLNIDIATKVIAGIANGCEQAGAALIGGETAEMPDMYNNNDYDLAGFCVGAVDKSKLIDGSSIKSGDAIIGMASSGPHSNGYSLIRKVLDVAKIKEIDGVPITDLLLKPTKIYVKSILKLMDQIKIKGMAHITGGGLTENIPRILAAEIHAEININSWKENPIFDWLAMSGNISTEEMRRTFNCGIGMVIIVDQDDIKKTLDILELCNETAWEIGKINIGSGGVNFI
ncbi:phosphoribosylformylglycinamidine cyclo-ligase [Woeseiaceae bacterium]|nr:phosphoribosylformylglycinamidine cyclo-ligase [Woeseiaceae bacterium]MDB2543751.1 phosphoribosylformylglycinamidine cyclo-ligase [Woeseiaceae bacterium]